MRLIHWPIRCRCRCDSYTGQYVVDVCIFTTVSLILFPGRLDTSSTSGSLWSLLAAMFVTAQTRFTQVSTLLLLGGKYHFSHQSRFFYEISHFLTFIIAHFLGKIDVCCKQGDSRHTLFLWSQAISHFLVYVSTANKNGKYKW